MRRIPLRSAALLVLLAAVPAATSFPNSEEEAVKSALNHYLLGQSTGDASHFKAVFHPESRLFFTKEGKLATKTAAEYIAGVAAKGAKQAPDEAQRKRWIEDVHITGDAAIARIVLDYPSARFTDYMSLLKVDGTWMIVNKTFHAESKPKS
jgi:hypothetical protein